MEETRYVDTPPAVWYRPLPRWSSRTQRCTTQIPKGTTEASTARKAKQQTSAYSQEKGKRETLANNRRRQLTRGRFELQVLASGDHESFGSRGDDGPFTAGEP